MRAERWGAHIIERFPEDLVTRPPTPALRQRKLPQKRKEKGAEKIREKNGKKQVGGCSCCDPLSSIHHNTRNISRVCVRGKTPSSSSIFFFFSSPKTERTKRNPNSNNKGGNRGGPRRPRAPAETILHLISSGWKQIVFCNRQNSPNPQNNNNQLAVCFGRRRSGARVLSSLQYNDIIQLDGF